MQDRVDVSSRSSEERVPDIKSIQLDNILPSSGDKTALLSNFSVLIARYPRKVYALFSKFGKELERHILHEYSEEMRRKSNVVCLFKFNDWLFC